MHDNKQAPNKQESTSCFFEQPASQSERTQLLGTQLANRTNILYFKQQQ
jgi:hypothetical protein